MRFARHEPLILFIGDMAVFYVSLWFTLALRNFAYPPLDTWLQHAIPFSFLFPVSVVVYFISGLYDQHTLLVRQRLPMLVTISQSVTVVVAAAFFFMVPYFGIAPKTNLAIFLVISSMLIIAWRITWGRMPRVRRQTYAMLLGMGKEIENLKREVHDNPRYNLRIVSHIAPADVVVSKELQEQMLAYIKEKNISVIIADTRDKYMSDILPIFYNLLFVRHDLVVVDAMHLYESIFRRVPVSMLQEAWFIQHITRVGSTARNFFHRAIDIALGLVVMVAWLMVLPFVWLAIRIEDRGPLYVKQIRVGQHNKPIRIIKFRTMSGSDVGDKVLKSTLTVTRVGAVLRPTRIDELPQCLNVLRGDLSFIGPRPELPALAVLYAEQIPYYRARHLIKPGLTGWAQL
ncbi:MAG: sugar transferase, partial [Candidatus Pacebacteria bacterium]|nr:sugar transferase [Candidatus Paceibacterota bacterium]